MNKRTKLVSLMAGMLLLGSTIGCDVDPSAIKPIAQNSGLFSAVGWIAIDNPTANEIDAVRTILAVISDKAGSVQDGATYTEVLYPEIEKVVDAELEQQYRPLAKAASISLLGALDMLFATHPEWKESQDTVADVVNSFILGASAGLKMKSNNEIRVIAEDMASRRARVFKQ